MTTPEQRHRYARELVEQLADTWVGVRAERPRVEFTDKLCRNRGVFTRGTNTLRLADTSFVQKPGVDSDVVTGVVAHELGHWADARLRRDDTWCRVMLGVFSLSLVMWASGELVRPWYHLPGAAVLATIAVGGVGMLVSVLVYARLSWGVEFRADRLAATRVGPGPVLAMLHTGTRHKRGGLTHPSYPARVTRLGGAVP